MTETSANELHNLLVHFNYVFSGTSGKNALNVEGMPESYAHMILKLSTLFAGTREDLMKAKFVRVDHNESLLRRLETIEIETFNSIASRGAGGSIGPIVSSATIERLLGIAEQLENAGFSEISIDRDQMISSTEALIAEVKGWELEDYAKRVLLVQLNSFSRVIHAADLYTSVDLRRHIKSIIADFASEFSSMDKVHQTQLQRLVGWGRAAFGPGSAVLGLASSGITIAGYLTKV